MKKFLFLLIILVSGCAVSPTHVIKKYNMRYYYILNGKTGEHDIWIHAYSDSGAYAMACDSFLSEVKIFDSTKNIFGAIPHTFEVWDSSYDFYLSPDQKDSIYHRVNTHPEYLSIDSSSLPSSKDAILAAKIAACPVIITKYWLTENDIGDPVAHLRFKNISKKKVDGIKIGIYCFNNFGEQISYGFDSYYSGITQDVILAGGTDYNYWTLSLFDNTTKIKPFITDVHYRDGSEWSLDN